MVACPNTVGQDFHPYIVVAVFEKFRPFCKILVRLKVFKDLLPLVLAPAVVQQIRFNEMHIQKGGQFCGILLCGVMLQRKGCCLFLRLFVRISLPYQYGGQCASMRGYSPHFAGKK